MVTSDQVGKRAGTHTRTQVYLGRIIDETGWWTVAGFLFSLTISTFRENDHLRSGACKVARVFRKRSLEKPL